MAEPITLLALAGSTRAGSLNKRLLNVAATAAEAAGAEVTKVDLADLPMPLYDGDLEQSSGLPENAKRLKALMVEHDAFLIASPEYNGGITATLKNAIDWASRREGDEAPAVAYRGKIAGLIAASPGRLGGARSLIALRQVLTSCGALVIPQQFTLAQAAQAFDDTGTLIDSEHEAGAAGVAQALVDTTRRQKG